jgi:hypothetical protein
MPNRATNVHIYTLDKSLQANYTLWNDVAAKKVAQYRSITYLGLQILGATSDVHSVRGDFLCRDLVLERLYG